MQASNLTCVQHDKEATARGGCKGAGVGGRSCAGPPQVKRKELSVVEGEEARPAGRALPGWEKIWSRWPTSRATPETNIRSDTRDQHPEPCMAPRCGSFRRCDVPAAAVQLLACPTRPCMRDYQHLPLLPAH